MTRHIGSTEADINMCKLRHDGFSHKNTGNGFDLLSLLFSLEKPSHTLLLLYIFMTENQITNANPDGSISHSLIDSLFPS